MIVSERLLKQPVFLSLVTTEPAGSGSIARFVARRCGAEIKSFDRLARGERLTLNQARLTGLTNTALDSAPDLDVTLQDFIEFAEGADAWIVEHGSAARELLRDAARSAGYPGVPGPGVIGIDELAAIVLPAAGRRGLSDLAEYFGQADVKDSQNVQAGRLHHEDTPSFKANLDGPELLEKIWSGLETELLRLPLPLLGEFNWMLAKTEHPLRKLLKAAETHAVGEQFGDAFNSGQVSLEKLFKDFSAIIETLRPDEEERQAIVEVPAEELVRPDDVRHLMGAEGPLSKLNGYEERPEQELMAARVAEAFNGGKHLMVEAGTGVGKSLAYLLPAILYAKKSGRPGIPSPHPKNLQSQLYGQDIPFWKQHLGVEFDAALLRGRPNYLCLRKFMYTLQEAAHELDDEERGQMLPVMSWAVKTASGDVNELAAFSPEQNPAP